MTVAKTVLLLLALFGSSGCWLLLGQPGGYYYQSGYDYPVYVQPSFNYLPLGVTQCLPLAGCSTVGAN